MAAKFVRGYEQHGAFIREISAQDSQFVGQQSLRWQQARYTLENEDLATYGKRLADGGRDTSPGRLVSVQRRQLMRRVPTHIEGEEQQWDAQVVVWTGATDRRFAQQMSDVQKDKAEVTVNPNPNRRPSPPYSPRR